MNASRNSFDWRSKAWRGLRGSFIRAISWVRSRAICIVWASPFFALVAAGPFVPRLIDAQPPTTWQRHFGEQTPALVLHWATGHAVLTHFRDKHFYVVA
jgi:hypothetical protein